MDFDGRSTWRWGWGLNLLLKKSKGATGRAIAANVAPTKYSTMATTPNVVFLQCTMATRPNLSGKCGWGRILRSVHHLSTASTGLVGRALIQGRGIGSWGTLPGSLFDKIHIVGDSKIVIDWALSHNFIIMPCLQHWLQNAQNLMASFSNITFEHVFWEQNLCAGALSKHDSIHFDSQVDGSVRGSGTFLF